ncbi:MAG: PQQ-binding-like beta-propeller repeat protein [Candidatus Hydrogenedentes bacterium]|nr:PQQ-binding-like beta-propeller repeat protein [Candidatus Hydrogenedentota bacterium]
MKTMFVALGLSFVYASAAGAQQTVWDYRPPSGFVDTSPGIGDINGDGAAEIILGTTTGIVTAIDGGGKELWRQDLEGHICFPPTVADLTGDGTPEALVMNETGQVFCLEGSTGQKLWEAKLPCGAEWGTTAPAAADVNGDGALEIVVGSRDGTVVCLRATGEQVWAAKTPCLNVLCPAVADVDGDGKAEVLVSGGGVALVCLSNDGKEKWRLGEGAGGSPFVYSVDGQGAPDILIGVKDQLLAVDGQGKTLWSCPLHKEMDSALAVADADGDGEAEIYAVDLSGYLACVSLKGQVRWSANVEERARRSPSIGDVDGDGVNEILVAGYSGALHVFDPQGRLKARVALSGVVNSTATLVTLGKAGLCVILPVGNGGVQALHWPGVKPDTKPLWPEFRYDSRRSGTIPADASKPAVTLSLDLGGMYVGTNCMTALVANPEKRTLSVRLEVARSNADPVTAALESAEETIEYKLWYTVPGAEAANLTFKCTVTEGTRALAQRSRTAYLVPFVKEFSDTEKALREVESRSAKLADAKGLEDRAFFLLAKLDGLRGQVGNAGTLGEDDRITLRDALDKILREAQSLLRLAKVAEEAVKSGSVIRVCAANPWAPFGGVDELSEGRVGPAEVAVKAFAGEVESAALNVFNLSSVPKTFYVEPSVLAQGDKTVSAKGVVSLFEVVDVPTEMRDHSGDALPGLNSGNLVQVPAWGARQLWLNVDTHALAPGDWTGNVRLRTLDVTPLNVSCPLKVKVWSAALPAKQTLRNCQWGYVHSSQLKEYPDVALDDQVRHGTNVFVSTIYPNATFDATGNLVGEVDFSGHDEYVKQHAPHGIILFCGYQGALHGPAPMDSEAYGKAHVQWLRAWVKHLADLGVGYDGFALYPVDEPGLSKGLVELYVRMAKLAREADPKILMYTDPVERITVDELREMLPYVDIWCPNRGGIVINKKSADKLDVIMKSGKTVWMYECNGNVKHQSPMAYYRAQSWLAWGKGITGIGYWTYCTSPDNPWFLPAISGEYMLVYPGNGVISSKRWEGVRDGVEDYGLLTALQNAVAAKGAAANPADVTAAQRLLGEQAVAIAGFCDMDTDKLDPGNKGLPGLRRLEDQRWAQVQAAREELARLLEAFNK